MKPLFTIHAGEYLTGCEIEKQFGKKVNVWVPVKDEGIDLLISDKAQKNMTSIQVKYSRDFNRTHSDTVRKIKLRSGGWWTFNRLKLEKSPADFWILLTYDAYGMNSDFIIIPPKKLLEIFDKTGRKQKMIQCYVWVTAGKNPMAIEGRGLSKTDSIDLIDKNVNLGIRDLTPYLSNWNSITKKLNIK